MKRQRRDAVELDVILNLEVTPDTTVADLQDIAERNVTYKRFFALSQLTAEGWCEAMGISADRHRAYITLNAPAPNAILNKSRIIARRLRRCIKTLKTMGL